MKMKFEIVQDTICENDVYYGRLVTTTNHEEILSSNRCFSREQIVDYINELCEGDTFSIIRMVDEQFMLLFKSNGHITWASERYTTRQNARKALALILMEDLTECEITPTVK